MKPVHIISIGAVLAIIGVIAAGIFLLSSIDKLVAGAIEEYGSQVTQTSVSVSDVSIELTSGKGGISGLTIGNPKGFTDPDIFKLGNITTALDIENISEETIVIKEISVSAPKVFYEINGEGDSNLDALKKNIQASTGAGKASKDDSKDSDAPKLIINRLVIDKGEVNARVAALGGEALSAGLPKIVLTDIGKDEGGASPAEVTEEIVNALMDKSSSAITNLDLDKYLGKSLEEVKALGSKLEDSLKDNSLGDDVGDTLEKGGEALKGLFD